MENNMTGAYNKTNIDIVEKWGHLLKCVPANKDLLTRTVLAIRGWN